MNHPAPYNLKLLPIFDDLMGKYTYSQYPSILDPFAGIGRIFQLQTQAAITAIDIEQWEGADKRVQQGNALYLPFDRETFDIICTSPTYGNRMADHHKAKDKSKRNTYRHRLGKELHADNSGAMQWGEQYRQFHSAAWSEATRVLRYDGLVILNIKDHIRAGERQLVSLWHYDWFQSVGYTHLETVTVACPGLKHGANRQRVEHELVICLRKTG